MDRISVNDNVIFCNDLPFVFIAGPCQIESLDHSLKVVDFLSEVCQKLSIPFVFKSSFDKANRTSIRGQRGIGIDKAIDIFVRIKEKFGCPILTDIHNENDCEKVKDVVDILQIPAFLSRQTDLLIAAGRTGKVVNVKKGQFLSPFDIKNAVEKIQYIGNENILLTERGVSFGYNQLVVDMKSLKIMSETTHKPVIFDATHSVQEPSGRGTSSGGDRRFAPVLARAAIASTPIAGIFCEVHDNPDNAPSDGANMLNFKMTEDLLPILKEFDYISKKI